ncbi:hypothetical protein Q4534_22125 [Cyclobacterium sp. 1_MG-2023]|uniref:hypothetical protein n=1 Tax=Cyclobacterium sp. 1_MG-2023 TaxID=3062681 RepID=UPI0026E3A5D8|nr:hypothetical protein [Cyclobacterium sp. 1_MG-2023]MDO6440141.1 hypothetical protein [Cyclobacterium sp. 1_MG-2023]
MTYRDESIERPCGQSFVFGISINLSISLSMNGVKAIIPPLLYPGFDNKNLKSWSIAYFRLKASRVTFWLARIK